MVRLTVTKKLVWRRFLTGVVCMCLCVWTTVPSASHTPKILETVQEHLQLIEDHGHSHGFEIDLLWAMHGHQHDLADHDHNTAVLVKSGPKSPHVFDTSSWRLPVSDAKSALTSPPKRPPRG
ncbi:hypothetical protein [Roseibium sp. MMSF_3412]|uniref:hypothetical protein n=1 Tax=Roseibium sp. MMSF_3412 TaxID=3046712 RepID=UPI00273F0368|nr:hypothetical protein [Roseibium sp. MMSF_3412]